MIQVIKDENYARLGHVDGNKISLFNNHDLYRRGIMANPKQIVPRTTERSPLLLVVPGSSASYPHSTTDVNKAAMSRRNFFSRLATYLYQLYKFPRASKNPTFGDVLRAIDAGTWKNRINGDNIPLPDIFDEKTWAILRECNRRVNSQMHCTKLELNQFGHEVAIFEPLDLVSNEDLLHSLTVVMKRIATTENPEISLMSYTTEDE